MSAITQLVDGVVPVAADWNGTHTHFHQILGTQTAITGYTGGDTLYASAADTLSKLPIGTEGQVLQVSSGLPAWGSSTSIGSAKFNGLRIAPDPNTPNTKVRILADSALLLTSTGAPKLFSAIDVTADLNTSGAGGLDTGSIAASTGYDLYLIGKTDGTVNAVWSKGLQWAAGITAVPDSDRDGTIALRDASARTQIGQKIPSTVTTGKLHSVDVSMLRTSTPTGSVWAELQSDSSGKPSGTTLSGGIGLPMPVDNFEGTNRYRARFVFPERPQLTNGTVYHVVFKGDFTIGASNLSFGTDTTSPANAGLSSFDGATWTVDTAKGLALFAVNILTGAESITFPSGYTYSGRVSWNTTNGSSVIQRLTQTGDCVTKIDNTLQTTAAPGISIWNPIDMSSSNGGPLPPAWAREYFIAFGPPTSHWMAVAVPLPIGVSTFGAGDPQLYRQAVINTGVFLAAIPGWTGPWIWTIHNSAAGKYYADGWRLDL